MTPIEIARHEELRQAKSTAELVDDALPIAGGWMAYGGLNSWANQACGLGLLGEVTNDELDSLVDFYTSRGVEPRIEVCPYADNTLVAGLAERGFRLLEFEGVFARDVTGDSLPKQPPHGWPDPLAIAIVDPSNADMVRDFVEVTTSALRLPDEPVDERTLELSRRMIEHADTDAFLATWDGIPVGGGAMESAGVIASLFSATVLPNWRRRGIQAALILRRMERAHANGCLLGIIHSSPGTPTERNALRFGFQLAYTKVIMVMPSPGLARSP